jgi:hypothetical protein
MITHVIKQVFGDDPSEFRSYITGTIGRTDSGALEVLNDRHKAKHGRDSIVTGLGSQRGRVYKRLLSVKASWQEKGRAGGDAGRLFTDLSQLSSSGRTEFLNELRTVLGELFGNVLKKRPLGVDDVLLDIPGRSLDEQIGAIHVCDLNADGRPINEVRSPFVEQLIHQFSELSRTVRIFIAPDVRDLIGKETVSEQREQIYNAVKVALKRAKGTPDMYK